MCSKTSIAVLVVVLAIASYSAADPPEFKCLGEKIDMSDKQEVLKQCREDLKDKLPADEDETPKSVKGVWRCFETCALKKMGILNSEDKIDLDVFNAQIDSKIPEGAREGIKSGIAKCAESMTDALSDDDNCKNHSAYQTCIMKSYMKNC